MRVRSLMPMASLEYKPGSSEDFDRFHRSSFNMVLCTIYGIPGDQAAAEDWRHDAFVRAFKAWKTWKPDDPAEAWLHRNCDEFAHGQLGQMRMRKVGELVLRLGCPGPARIPPRSRDVATTFAPCASFRPTGRRGRPPPPPRRHQSGDRFCSRRAPTGELGSI
jgi:hypothetical protein